MFPFFLLFYSLASRADFQSSDEAAARNAFHEATDEWASAEYRMDLATTQAKRYIEDRQAKN
jgi:hypothetical protein